MTRILLSFACALALILIPLSYSPVWAQTTSPSTTQQDRIARNDAKQDQTNPDQNQTQTNQDLNQNQSNAPSTDVNSSGMRQKPSSSEESNPSATQDQNRTQNQNQNRTDTYSNQTTKKSQSRTESQPTGSQTTDQNASGNRNLPNTAGELPLLALIGLLCLGTAAGTRILVRVRSSR